jgi:hypothetical protein
MLMEGKGDMHVYGGRGFVESTSAIKLGMN